MTSHPTDNTNLPFYLTRPSPCPYLAGRVEQKIFTRLSGDAKSDFLLNNQLNQTGFRRSQTMLYRPACPSCLACVPVRINLKNFAPTANLRRILKRTDDLTAAIYPVSAADECYDLFLRYQNTRHAEGDVTAMSFAEFKAMMQDGANHAFLFALNDADGNARAVMLVDRLHQAVSAVYSYYEPADEKRSLGTALILRLAAWAQTEHYAHLYLGYWIKDCNKMSYKARFPALQSLGPHGWEDFISPHRK